tara:strand:- start:205 stop:453 length:249 start_codon:yes stop_codon:yes gene_type:complete
MARRASKKDSKEHRKNAREVKFIGGSFDGKKWWIVYPCPEMVMMNMGRDPYYLIKGSSSSSPQYEYDPDRFNKERDDWRALW